MWINEIVNIVLENKDKKSFYEKSLWSHDDINVIIQFVHCYSWGAIELTSEQYEAIEKMSSDKNTYDTQYNSNSQYNVMEFEEVLFIDGKNFVGAEICRIKDPLNKYKIPNDSTLESISNMSWFAEKYGVIKRNISENYNVLSENGWKFLGQSYSIMGDITVMKKSNYDYLWINDDTNDKNGTVVQRNSYDLRICFLNNRDKESTK